MKPTSKMLCGSVCAKVMLAKELFEGMKHILSKNWILVMAKMNLKMARRPTAGQI